MRARLLLGMLCLLALAVSATGCTRFAVGVQHIPRRFYCKGDLPPGSQVELVRSERKTLYGFNLMLWQLAKPDVHSYFMNLNLADDEYVTNISIANTSASFLLFVYLFTVTHAKIEYDVVKISPSYAESGQYGPVLCQGEFQ